MERPCPSATAVATSGGGGALTLPWVVARRLLDVASMGPHDKLFRRLLKERGAAEALIRERLPRRTVAAMRGHVERLPESFVDEKLRASQLDALFRVRLAGGRAAYVYCLIEHKRTDAAETLLQLRRYLAAVYADLERRHPLPLPVVVPLVVYNGRAPWRGPRRFSEVLDARPELRGLMLDFGFVLVDLSAEPVARLSRHARLRSGLAALKAGSVRARDLPEVLEHAVRSAADPSTVRAFVSYLLEVKGRRVVPALRRALEKSRTKEASMETAADYLRKQGFKVGRRKGRVEGREEGRTEMLREAVRRVVVRRFKRVTPAFDEQLGKADASTLETWFDRALEARSLRSLTASAPRRR